MKGLYPKGIMVAPHLKTPLLASDHVDLAISFTWKEIFRVSREEIWE
jgi:hypothetical protein